MTIKDISKAYPVSALKVDVPIEDKVGGKNILVYCGQGNTGYVEDEGGNLLFTATMDWFSWSSFNKNTAIYHRGEI